MNLHTWGGFLDFAIDMLDLIKMFRYIAATCDPADFQKDGYTLRQNLLHRETELFIVLTMYNVSVWDEVYTTCQSCLRCSLFLSI